MAGADEGPNLRGEPAAFFDRKIFWGLRPHTLVGTPPPDPVRWASLPFILISANCHGCQYSTLAHITYGQKPYRPTPVCEPVFLSLVLRYKLNKNRVGRSLDQLIKGITPIETGLSLETKPLNHGFRTLFSGIFFGGFLCLCGRFLSSCTQRRIWSKKMQCSTAIMVDDIPNISHQFYPIVKFWLFSRHYVWCICTARM